MFCQTRSLPWRSVETGTLRYCASIPRVPRRSREGDRVADVGEAGDVGKGALEAEAKAGVRHRAVAPEVAVPGVVLPVDAALDHAAVQYVETLLALAAADDLADPRCEPTYTPSTATAGMSKARARTAGPPPAVTLLVGMVKLSLSPDDSRPR
jgi:hypothetical protein